MIDVRKTRYPTSSTTELYSRVKRKIALMANFILCRVLIAIIQNLGSKPFSPNLGARLEKMIFDQLVVSDPDSNARFVNINANFVFFSKLMGTLSEVRFPTICDGLVSRIRVENCGG